MKLKDVLYGMKVGDIKKFIHESEGPHTFKVKRKHYTFILPKTEVMTLGTMLSILEIEAEENPE